MAAAAARLCGHHGSAMVPPLATATPGRKADWYCHKCGVDKITFGKFDSCHFCGGAKRVCHGGPAPKKASGGVRDRPSTAQRQVDRQRTADNTARGRALGAVAFDKRVAELKAENVAKDKLLKAANAEVKQLRAAPPAAVAAVPPGDKALLAALRISRDKLAKLFGPTGAPLAGILAEIATLEAKEAPVAGGSAKLLATLCATRDQWREQGCFPEDKEPMLSLLASIAEAEGEQHAAVSPSERLALIEAKVSKLHAQRDADQVALAEVARKRADLQVEEEGLTQNLAATLQDIELALEEQRDVARQFAPPPPTEEGDSTQPIVDFIQAMPEDPFAPLGGKQGPVGLLIRDILRGFESNRIEAIRRSQAATAQLPGADGVDLELLAPAEAPAPTELQTQLQAMQAQLDAKEQALALSRQAQSDALDASLAAASAATRMQEEHAAEVASMRSEAAYWSASVLVQAGVAKENADKLIQEAKEAHGDRDKRRKTAAGSAVAA